MGCPVEFACHSYFAQLLPLTHLKYPKVSPWYFLGHASKFWHISSWVAQWNLPVIPTLLNCFLSLTSNILKCLPGTSWDMLANFGISHHGLPGGICPPFLLCSTASSNILKCLPGTSWDMLAILASSLWVAQWNLPIIPTWFACSITLLCRSPPNLLAAHFDSLLTSRGDFTSIFHWR